jgi:hypothetical protein
LGVSMFISKYGAERNKRDRVRNRKMESDSQPPN